MAMTAKDFELSDEQLQRCLGAYELAGRPDRFELLQDDIGYSDEMVLELYTITLDWTEDKRHEDCIAAYHFLTTLNPQLAVLWVALGVSYMHQQDFPAAEKAFDRAIEAEPQNILGYQYGAKCYIDQGNKEAAKRLIERGIERAEKADDTEAWAEFKELAPQLAEAIDEHNS